MLKCFGGWYRVEQVELRRLKLTFRARWLPAEGAEGAAGRRQYKLYLDGQTDLFISNFRSPAICKLLTAEWSSAFT